MSAIFNQAAGSSRLRSFTLVFSLLFPLAYAISDFMGLPLFTWYPAVERLEWGLAQPSSQDGPAMYWYGWVATCLIVCSLAGGLASLLPGRVAAKLPMALVWLLPLVALAVLAWKLMPFWTHA